MLEKCVGIHHSPGECFSKPQNFEKRGAWIVKKEARKSNNSSQPKSSNIVGMVEIRAPSASAVEGSTEYFYFNSHFFELNTDEKKEIQCNWTMSDPVKNDDNNASGLPSILGSNLCALATETSEKSLWGLFDTGAKHNMFNKLDLFESSSMTAISPDNNQLKFAGGNARLKVISKGTPRGSFSFVYYVLECVAMEHIVCVSCLWNSKSAVRLVAEL